MSLTISAVFISGLQQIFACEEMSYVKVSNFTNDEGTRYR